MTDHAAIHAAMKGAAAALRLPLRRARFTGPAGGVGGRGTGSSLEFEDHRRYVPGDDPRHINWQASARSGEYTLKTWREEVSPRIDLLLDHSPSMFLLDAKARRTWELAYFLVEAALRAGGHLRIVRLARDGGAAEEVPLERVLAHAWPEPAPSARSTAVAPAIARARLRAGSLRVVVSDLLDPAAPSEAAGLLVAGGGRAIVLAPFAAAERDPDWAGSVDFEDCESGARRPAEVDDAILARYREAWTRHYDAWHDACARRGIGMARVGDGGTFLEALRAEAIPAGVIEAG
ncbi:MAG: DUF58 domain-containing protein [Planctomycetaceae bacterium]